MDVIDESRLPLDGGRSFPARVSGLVFSTCSAKLTFSLEGLTFMLYTQIEWDCANAVFRPWI